MKTQSQKAGLNQSLDRKESGALLLPLAIMTAVVIGVGLASYMELSSQAYIYTNRSLAWNQSMVLIDAGSEEAIAHLNANSSNLGADGWGLTNGAYQKTRKMDGGYYHVTISNTSPPVVYVDGYSEIPLQTNYSKRTARIGITTLSPFPKGMIAQEDINMNGNNVATDSFDSADPVYSTGGLYDAAKAKDNGDVATNSGLVNSLNVGNADIKGRVSTGPGGSVAIGPNGVVGDAAWHAGGNRGIQPGYSSDDMNVAFQEIQAPYASGMTPVGVSSGKGGGTTYTLTTGNWETTAMNLSGRDKVLVTGDANLYVTSSFSMSGQSEVEIQAGASLNLYMGAASASIAGNGLVNGAGNATNFFYWGLPSNTSLSFQGNGTFTGAIYAPEAAFSMSGGGGGAEDFIGASVSKTVTMNGHFNFHYDENLARIGSDTTWLVDSWEEI